MRDDWKALWSVARGKAAKPTPGHARATEAGAVSEVVRRPQFERQGRTPRFHCTHQIIKSHVEVIQYQHDSKDLCRTQPRWVEGSAERKVPRCFAKGRFPALAGET